MEGLELLQDVEKKLQSIVNLQRVYVRKIVEENDEAISRLVTNQMEIGVSGDGQPIRPEYSPRYAAFKGFETPDLKLTGAFHESVYAEAQGDGVEIDATDPKTGQLVDKYGENILSLTDVSIDDFNEEILIPQLMIKNDKYLGI